MWYILSSKFYLCGRIKFSFQYLFKVNYKQNRANPVSVKCGDIAVNSIVSATSSIFVFLVVLLRKKNKDYYCLIPVNNLSRIGKKGCAVIAGDCRYQSCDVFRDLLSEDFHTSHLCAYATFDVLLSARNPLNPF